LKASLSVFSMLLFGVEAHTAEAPSLENVPTDDSPAREVVVETVSTQAGPLSRAKVNFSVYASGVSSTPKCVRMPLFTTAMRSANLSDTLERELQGQRFAATTVLQTRGRDVLEELEGLPADLWRHSSDETPAACTAKCLALPSDVRPTQITLRGENGRDICLQLPNRQNSTFESASARCVDGSTWYDVVAFPALKGDWLVCGTVANAGSSAVSRHRLEVTFERLRVKTIATR
jgi:hypothetical protein